MEYAKSGFFTSKQFSIDETLTEIDDVVTIALDCVKSGDLKLAQTNLNQVAGYLTNVRRKVKIALEYVPKSVQEKEFL